MSVRLAKTQISLGIHLVWSESSLSAWKNLGSLATHWVHSEDSDQTGRMPRLIWVFAGRTLIFVGFVIAWLKLSHSCNQRSNEGYVLFRYCKPIYFCDLFCGFALDDITLTVLINFEKNYAHVVNISLSQKFSLFFPHSWQQLFKKSPIIYLTSFEQVPVLVIFVLKCSLLKIFFFYFCILKGNATLKHSVLQSEELHKTWILIQIRSKSVEN